MTNNEKEIFFDFWTTIASKVSKQLIEQHILEFRETAQILGISAQDFYDYTGVDFHEFDYLADFQEECSPDRDSFSEYLFDLGKTYSNFLKNYLNNDSINPEEAYDHS